MSGGRPWYQKVPGWGWFVILPLLFVAIWLAKITVVISFKLVGDWGLWAGVIGAIILLQWEIRRNYKVRQTIADEQFPSVTVIEGESLSPWLFLVTIVVAGMCLPALVWRWASELVTELGLSGNILVVAEWATILVTVVVGCWVALFEGWFITRFCHKALSDSYTALILVNTVTGALRILKTGRWVVLPWEKPTSDGEMHMGLNPIPISHFFSLNGGGAIEFDGLVAYHRRMGNLEDVSMLTKDFIESRILKAVLEVAGKEITPRSVEEAQRDIVLIREEIEKSWEGLTELEEELGCSIRRLQINLRMSKETQDIIDERLKAQALANAGKAIAGISKEQLDAVLLQQQKMTRNQQEVTVTGGDGAEKLAGLIMAVASKLGISDKGGHGGDKDDHSGKGKGKRGSH